MAAKGKRGKYQHPVSEVTRQVYETICEHPGITVWEIGKELGRNPRGMQSRVAALEAFEGMLVYEDDYGRLFPFEKGD